MVPVVAVDELEELEEVVEVIPVEVGWEANPGLVLELVFEIPPGKFVEEWRVGWLVVVVLLLLLLLHQSHLELVHLLIQWLVMMEAEQLSMVEGE